jgi:hypothetical protein
MEKPHTDQGGTKVTRAGWWAKGLLFENCSCQLVCPGHMSFKQLCTYGRCVGHWAVHIEEGRYGEVSLDGQNLVILYDAPQHMITGGWTEVFYLDERSDHAQREALETIFSGQAGGPWEVLARFVAKRLPTRSVPLRFADEGRRKRMWAEPLFDTSIEAIRGQDKSKEAVMYNVFNQIHGAEHVLARGQTSCSDKGFPISLEDSHALYSRFSWEVA